jgi:hypothetical protein
MKQRIRIHKAEPNQGVHDYSHLLDAPAGKHGFVFARKGHFYFKEGKRARFLGFNIAARSNTPDHETAEKLAERFASMGVNVIRLHAADAPVGEEPRSWSSCVEAPLLDYSGGTSGKFNPEGRDRFDYLFAKLKEKGIYLHIDLLVARVFLPGDKLDYPGKISSTAKCYPTMNERLIKLQQEFAKEMLLHVNPYTGLALIDDPAVMTIQISNEESAIKGTREIDGMPEMQPYRDERKKRFNDFLLAKYHSREHLEEAWTFNGIRALGEGEDPALGTVEVVQGDFVQPVNDPMGKWDGDVSPARYADYMEFGVMMNRKYYQRMKDYVVSLGAKVPVVCSNLLGGAADVYGHSDGDLMENNSYFNHPVPPFHTGNDYTVAGPMEYVSHNPLTMQRGIGSLVTAIISLGATAVIQGKPFMLSEWNEYGLRPFHSTALVHTVAYACLNDWDGLILYNHHTSERWDDQPADEILSVFDAYNDPSVICQWGFMATIFLKGLVAPSPHRADIVYTQNDLKTLPNWHAMPNTYLPYVTSLRNVFLDGGEQYQGDADVAVNAGFFNGADLSASEHGVYYAWSPYRDPWRRALDNSRLSHAAGNTDEIKPGIHLGDHELVFKDINAVAGSGDYREFAAAMDRALKKWGILPEDSGLVDGRLISDTKELVFDPDHSRFSIHTPYCGYFSGAPEEIIKLSDNITARVRNDRISLSLLPVGQKDLNGAEEYLLTAMGGTGMDETTSKPGPDIMGIPLTILTFAGKLYADTMEGALLVKAEAATLQAFNPVGELLTELEGAKTEDGVRFDLSGEVPAVQFLLKIQG